MTEHPDTTMRKKRVDPKLDFAILLFLCLATFFISARFDLLESLVDFSRQHENWEIDEILISSIMALLVLAAMTLRYARQIRNQERETAAANAALRRTLEEVKQLRGLVPICAACKKIRDDSGFWHQVETYISLHTDAQFSHGICPKCAKELYPEIADEIEKESSTSL